MFPLNPNFQNKKNKSVFSPLHSQSARSFSRTRRRRKTLLGWSIRQPKANRHRLLPAPAHAALGRRLPLREGEDLGLAARLGDVKVKDAVIGVPVVVAADARPEEARVRDDDNILFRPVVQLAQGVLAAGDDGFLGGKVLGAGWGRLVGEDGVDLGEVDFGEQGADFFDGGAGVAGFCGGFCGASVSE